jgi:hypothetical protein
VIFQEVNWLALHILVAVVVIGARPGVKARRRHTSQRKGQMSRVLAAWYRVVRQLMRRYYRRHRNQLEADARH